MAQLLWNLAEDEQLPLGYRLLAVQVRDLARSQILGLPTLGDERHMLEALRLALNGRAEEHPEWVCQLPKIIALWRRVVGGLET